MMMSEEEICREFRLAASKTKQLQILADENVCTKKEIAEILIRNGEEGVPKWYTNPPKEKPKKEAPAPALTRCSVAEELAKLVEGRAVRSYSVSGKLVDGRMVWLIELETEM